MGDEFETNDFSLKLGNLVFDTLSDYDIPYGIKSILCTRITLLHESEKARLVFLSSQPQQTPWGIIGDN